MDPTTATHIASLSWIARLFRWQIAIVIIIGFVSLGLAVGAIYSFVGGQLCWFEVDSKFPVSKELGQNLKVWINAIGKPKDQLTDTERRLQAEMVDWWGQRQGPMEECKKQWSVYRWLFSTVYPISPAYAQAKIGGFGQEDVRLMVVITIFATLAVFFVICVCALLFSSSPAVITFAADSVKSLLGFFIGVGMSFMGISK